jgi:GT2 family glycosyltransferase
MATCITGMHRSGTSMVAKLLYVSGLYLGPEDELLPATPDNADGHWENVHFIELNDKILNEFGGGWDYPPLLPDGWCGGGTDCQSAPQRLLPLREKAAALVQQFRDHEPWGWKDPRTSLTLPFWQSLLPGLKVVICLRNPLEVALSLRRRGWSSYALSLDLWRIYNAHILRDVPPERRIITHYDRYSFDPEPELRRVLAFLDMSASQENLRHGCSAAKTELRHGRFTTRHLLSADVSPEVLRLYLQMQEEADWNDSDLARRPPQQDVTELPVEREGRQLDPSALDLAHWHRERQELKQRLAARDDTIQQLQAQLTSLRQERERLQQTLGEQLRRRDEEIQSALYELQVLSGLDRKTARAKVAYLQLARRIRGEVRRALPLDATVIVVSKGDDNLLRLDGRKAWHFPQAEGGVYAGFNPADSGSAIVQLEALRSNGAQFLLFPSTSLWWLDHYRGLKTHLDRHYRRCVNEADTCVIYALDEPPAADKGQRGAEVGTLIAEYVRRFGKEPAILDWHTNLNLEALFPEQTVFSPPAQMGETVPYLDHTVDVVAVAEPDAARASEARRVAAAAVVTWPAAGGAAEVEWLKGPQAAPLPTTSIVIPSYNGIALTEACLRALAETLPSHLHVEIIVVDDCSTDDTAPRLARCLEREPRLKVLRNPQNCGFLVTCNNGAAAAGGEIVILLNNDTLPLYGWLEPLLCTFRDHPDAGAVGGKLVYPDGRLQEAGGLVFADGSAANFGKGDYALDAPLYNFLREVDYVTGALIATPRALFSELGGLDTRYRPIYYEETDYCFRLREKGYKVYYQPESVVIHLEGVTCGTDPSSGQKRHQVANRAKFVERWQEALKRQPPPPGNFKPETWYALAAPRGPDEWEGGRA